MRSAHLALAVLATLGPGTARGALRPGDWQLQAGISPAYHQSTELRFDPGVGVRAVNDVDVVPSWHAILRTRVTEGLSVLLPAGLAWDWHRGQRIQSTVGAYVSRFGHSYTAGALLELEAFAQGRFRISDDATVHAAYRFRPVWALNDGSGVSTSHWLTAAVELRASEALTLALSAGGGRVGGMVRDEGAVWSVGGWGLDTGGILPFVSYRVAEGVRLFAAWEVAQHAALFGHTEARAVEIRTALGVDWRFVLNPPRGKT
jgi:hypothetical protein